MKKDIDFIRDALLEIEENCEPTKPYQILSVMERRGYDKEYAFGQLCIMEDAGLFKNTIKDLDPSFYCMGLSNYGFDFLDRIRNDTVWMNTKKEIKEKNLPKTIKYIAEIAGTFLGAFLKQKNG